MTRYADERVQRGQPMPGLLRLVDTSPSDQRSRTSCWWPSAAEMENGKVRSATCHCANLVDERFSASTEMAEKASTNVRDAPRVRPSAADAYVSWADQTRPVRL